MRTLAFVVAAALSTGMAHAAAWTLPRGHWQVFTATTQSSAELSFDDKGRADLRASFNKLLIQNTFEYGLTGYLTLFATPDYVLARVQPVGGATTHVSDASLEGGARLLLDGRHGDLSIQGSYKTAGAFDLSVSANRASGRQIELRLLYGTSFKLFGRDGFLDLQAAQRWIASPRPDETPVDLTAGLWLNKRWMVMLQSFNIVSAGDAKPPYTYYRSHKLELSLVQKLSRHWSLQVGAFYSPAGQNALVERGVQVSLWTQD
ncbi:MAG TPA: hypothetical protein VJ476_10985 [Rhizomicrobium sp.]|nr:hypothetical protein [Rhizomicrobium sp.]